MKKFLLRVCCLIVGLGCVGCGDRVAELPPKAPRPVSVFELKKTSPKSSFNISGLVKSWKTEQIGFEVSGRIRWVLEPGKNVVGQVKDANENELNKGTPLAAIDPSRYQVAEESAKAALEVATLERNVAKLRWEQSVEADIDTAQADLNLAQTELDRMQKLKDQGAISNSEFDAAKNRVTTSQLRLKSLETSRKQAKAEYDATEARVRSAQQALADAERDLENTVLYGSYRGQISEVNVVPGSVVSQGQPVLTLQMMDPIKVEVEVSAEQSRELQRRRQVPVSFVLPDGTRNYDNALVYIVDPSADPSTRTFTVTLLILNKQYRPALPQEITVKNVARTQNVWPVDELKGIVGVNTSPDTFFVEEKAIERDETGEYVWVMTNVSIGEPMPPPVKVRKVRIEKSDVRIPFLGNWVFCPAKFLDNSLDKGIMIAGELEFPDFDRADWDGESIFVDSGLQWMLRPGDLVNVDLSGGQNLDNGYFIPVEAIYEDLDKTFVFTVVGGKVTKTEVNAIKPKKLDSGSLIQITPKEGSQFEDGTKLVFGGVHFLKDGDAVNVVEEIDMDQAGESQ